VDALPQPVIITAVTYQRLFSVGLALSFAGAGCERHGGATAPSPGVVAPAPAPARPSGEPAASERVTEPALPAAPGAPVAGDKTASDRASFEKTVGIVEVKREGAPSVLHAVRAATNDGHDRVVFEFRDAVPGFHLEYIDKPVRDCGAGDVKPIEGDGWLEVRFYPAYAHTEEGQPTVAERELRPALPVVREIERTCDFEAVVTWVVGTASPNRFRAFELAAPPRLVVDIEH
jgi:hypothetical protein